VTVLAWVFISGGLIIGLALFLVSYYYCKNRQFNAALMPGTGKKKPKKRSVDLTKYMDDTFTAGLDDDADIQINPVIVHRMEAAKSQKRKAKTPGGGGRSGGLARLNLTVESKKVPGKSNTAKNIEKYLGTLGVDTTEQRAVGKNTEAGFKGMTAMQAATSVSASSMKDQSKARTEARQAIQKAKTLRDLPLDEDEEGGGLPPKGQSNQTDL